jgi:hypothetical protein
MYSNDWAVLVKIDTKETGLEGVNWLDLAQGRDLLHQVVLVF